MGNKLGIRLEAKRELMEDMTRGPVDSRNVRHRVPAEWFHGWNGVQADSAKPYPRIKKSVSLPNRAARRIMETGFRYLATLDDAVLPSTRKDIEKLIRLACMGERELIEELRNWPSAT